jgi:molybdopterin/thiamine biosynthesis adenylyltransferase
VCGEEADVGKFKVNAAARFFHRNQCLAFEPVVGKNESACVSSLCEGAHWIFSCANTIPARMAAAQVAVRLAKPIIDVGVSDGRESLAATIKYWLPECADWSACPGCHLVPSAEIHRNEGLLFTVLASASALAAHVFVAIMTGVDGGVAKSQNYLAVEMGKNQIETLAVLRRTQCRVCSNTRPQNHYM